ncbi:MAG TPA: hypothetical protein VMT59_16260 [Gaiellaceae bacterium]|nr:hypothetical protein [Gaiellaceae bacterium]
MARPTTHDPDLVLVDRMLAPPPLDEARRSLEFWQTRKRSLPLYKRTARREADAMIARWQERVRAAERARFASTPLGWIVGKLWPGRVMIDRRTVVGFAWKSTPPALRLAVGWFVLLSIVMTAVGVAAFVLILNAIA